MRNSLRSISLQVLGVSVAAVVTFVASGCGTGIAGGNNPTTSGVAAMQSGISGTLHGGQNPVSGSIIQLYTVGTTGYTSAATPLIPASDQMGGVGSVVVSATGSNYTAPTVSFSGGGDSGSDGCGAAATANLGSGASAGKIVSITVTTHGGGCTFAPATVTITDSTGSGATATALFAGNGNALTDANGNFSISANYTCPTGGYVYITASGGNPGAGTGSNPNIALMAALGPCSLLNSSTFLTINEVTTVAAAYALAQFSSGSSFGTALSAKPGSSSSAPSDNFATSSTNVQGIANAFATAQVLANTATGQSPGNNANGTATPEFWQVNLIADILAACINSASPYTSCNTLYDNVNGTTPGDTIQAALDLALHPTLTGGTTSSQIYKLFNLIPAQAPFVAGVPTVYTNIYDFTIGIAYSPVIPGSTVATSSNDLLFQTDNVSIDKYGNVWVANVVNFHTPQGSACTAGTHTAGCDGWIMELDPTGNPIPAGSASVGGTSASNYMITSYSIGNNSTSTTYQGNNSGTGYPPIGMAIDTNNNVWVADYSNNNVMVIPGSGAAYGTGSGFTGTGGYATSVYNGGNGVGNGTSTIGAYGYAVGTGTTNPTAIAIDGQNDVFISTYSGSVSGICTTGKTNTGIGNVGGLVTFVAGSPSNVNYSKITASPSVLAIDSGTLDTVSVNGTATAIPGSPFVWSGYAGNAAIGMSYTTTGGGTVTQGCFTPVSYGNNGTNYGIAGANYTSVNTVVPVANGTLDPAVSSDPITAMIAPGGLYGLATDSSGNIWASSLAAVDTNSDAKYVVTKITPNYGTSTTTVAAGFTSAHASANYSYVEYHDIAGMNSGVTGAVDEARALSSDGGGNIWWGLTTGFIGGISSMGTPLSPAYGASSQNGFAGSACNSSTASCVYTGTTTTYTSRGAFAGSARQPIVDLSGNIWVPQQQVNTYPGLTVLVGVGVPLASPWSSALAAGKYGQKP